MCLGMGMEGGICLSHAHPAHRLGLPGSLWCAGASGTQVPLGRVARRGPRAMVRQLPRSCSQQQTHNPADVCGPIWECLLQGENDLKGFPTTDLMRCLCPRIPLQAPSRGLGTLGKAG